MGRVVETMITSFVVAGEASGTARTADVPLSMWGGLDPATGEIIDRRHPLSGFNVAGEVLVIPHGRGSCSASGVLLESIRNRTAPVAIIVSRIDPIIGLGSILGDELYGTPVPVVVIPEQMRSAIADGDTVTITTAGRLLVDRPEG